MNKSRYHICINPLSITVHHKHINSTYTCISTDMCQKSIFNMTKFYNLAQNEKFYTHDCIIFLITIYIRYIIREDTCFFCFVFYDSTCRCKVNTSKLSALAYKKQPVDNQLYTVKSIYQFTLVKSSKFNNREGWNISPKYNKTVCDLF